MAEKRKRSQNFTKDEKVKLVQLVYAYRHVILNKRTHGTTNQAMNEAWIDLCTQYNSTGNMQRCRSKDVLIRVWEKMKSEARMYNSRNRSCTTGMGGGPYTSKTEPILEQVCDLMGRECSGIADVLDSDSVIPIPNNTKVTDFEVVAEELQTIILDAELATDKSINEVKAGENKETNTPSCSKIQTTPFWKRRRPILKKHNQQLSEVVATLCTGFQGMNKKKVEVEDLKNKLLEEIEFKRNLYNLQLESARKDLEIKIEVLNQIKGGNFNLMNLFGVPKSDYK